MPNPYGAPEISVQAVAEKRKAGDAFVWLDVREPNEYALVQIEADNLEFVPLSRLSIYQVDALPEAAQDKEAEIIVFCHHGMRSAQVTAWLQQQGWHNVKNMTGGIHQWATEIDPSIGTY